MNCGQCGRKIKKDEEYYRVRATDEDKWHKYCEDCHDKKFTEMEEIRKLEIEGKVARIVEDRRPSFAS